MFDLKAIADSKAHALKCFPEECCGAITADGYVPFQNVSTTPKESFDCRVEGQKLALTTPLLALVHSHPISSLDLMEGSYGPSRGDMQQQIVMNIPWGIIATDGFSTVDFFWGDSLPIPPLLGRQFRHGPSGTDGRGDCYALIRDYYRLNLNKTLVEGPRDNMWWTSEVKQNLYLENFERAGFKLAERADPEVGDVALGCVGSVQGVPNHGGIYAGNGLILHHLPKRFSREEPIGNWMKHITHWLRHYD